MAVEVGSEAPDFTLRNEDGEEVTLSSLRGQNVVLSSIRSRSARSARRSSTTSPTWRASSATAAGVRGLRRQPVRAQGVQASDENLSAHLLSDFEPKGAVAQQYGAYLDGLGFATRATFVIDKDGKVAWKQVNSPGEARDQEQVVEALAACPV